MSNESDKIERVNKRNSEVVSEGEFTYQNLTLNMNIFISFKLKTKASTYYSTLTQDT